MNNSSFSLAAHAVLALTEIKDASAAFDRGDMNIFDTIDAIVIACEAYRSATQSVLKAA